MEPLKSENKFKNFFECVVEMIKKNEGQIVQAATEEVPEFVTNLKLPKESKNLIKNLGVNMLKMTGLSPTNKSPTS
jgi:hypothetical protein